MRIANLKVQNFKAFYGDKPYEFDFLGTDGKSKYWGQELNLK